MIAKASVAVPLLKPVSAMILMMCSWSRTSRGNACSAAAISLSVAHLVAKVVTVLFYPTEVELRHDKLTAQHHPSGFIPERANL